MNKITFKINWQDEKTHEYHSTIVRANTAQKAVNIATERIPETAKILTVDKKEHCWDWKDPRK